MKGCAVLVLVLLLLAMNGYALWQIVRLRAEVAELRRDVADLDRSQPQSDVDLAEAALKAVQRGQWERARAALDALAERMERTGALARRDGRELQQRLAEAQRALDQKRQDAAAAIQALRDGLLPHKRNGHGRREEGRSIGNSPLAAAVYAGRHGRPSPAGGGAPPYAS